MYINQIITQGEKENILSACEKAIKKYYRLYKKNTIIFSIVLFGAGLCSLMMLLYSMYQHAILLMTIIPVAVIQIKTNNDGYKLRKQIINFSNTDNELCNPSEYKLIANNEYVTINEELLIKWQDVLAVATYKDYVIVMSKNKRSAIMQLDYNMRKIIIDKVKSYNAYLIIMDTDKENVELAKKYIRKAQKKNNILLVLVLILMYLYLKLI